MPRHCPGDRVDRYLIEELLGSGAWAEVYRATDTRTGGCVVLKSPDPSLFGNPVAHARYRREIAIARSIDHPGVQRSLDGGHNRMEPYEILEYVDGDNLRAVIARYRPGAVPIPQVVDWGIQVAGTLSYLHGQGIVHRDLKPENILLGRDGGLRIVDFGAALKGSRFSRWRPVVEPSGTPDYMSPEHIRGGSGDNRSDLYALGVILYELLSGAPPFSGTTTQDTMAAHLTASPTPLHSARWDVPPALEAVIARALRRRPEDRYQSAGAMLADLIHLDRVDVSGVVDPPDAPTPGGPVGPDAHVWRFAVVVAAGFVVLAGAVIAASVLLR